MAELKVLMLGWHFSARISGGMGVASYQIAKSISEKVTLTVILPSYDKNTHPLKAKVLLASEITKNEIRKNSVSYVHHFTSTESLLISPYKSIQHEKTESIGKEDSVYSSTQIALESYNDVLVELALKQEFDIIHCHDWMTFAAGIALKNITGKKLVVHIHSLEYHRGNSDSWIFGLERKAMDMADAVISVSNYSKEIARKYYNIYSEKIRTVYNGISIEDKTERAAKGSQNIVVFAGRLSEQKGIRAFIQIAVKVYSHLPDTQFVIAGDGELKEEIKNMVQLLVIKDTIHLLGHLEKEELLQLFAGSDVLCMPSISEPFGMVAMEAANQGVACALSNQSGVIEILESSLKSDPDDVDGFALNIISILEDKNIKQTIVYRQSDEIKDFTWEKTGKDILKIYSSL